MPLDRIFNFRRLPPSYLDECIRGLEPLNECRPPFRRWRRIPLDLLPLRSRTIERSTGNQCRWFVIPAELAIAICEGLGGHDCGCDGDELAARWIKSRIAIRRHAMGVKE